MEKFLKLCKTYVDFEVFEEILLNYEILFDLMTENLSFLTLKEDKIMFNV